MCKKVVENEVERDRLRYYEEEGKERKKLEKKRLVRDWQKCGEEVKKGDRQQEQRGSYREKRRREKQ